MSTPRLLEQALRRHISVLQKKVEQLKSELVYSPI